MRMVYYIGVKEGALISYDIGILYLIVRVIHKVFVNDVLYCIISIL